MKQIDVDDDTPAPFVKIRSKRKLFGPRFDNHGAGLAGCKGKIAHPSAHAAAKALRYAPDINGRRIYRCRICHLHHIGSGERE